MAVNAIPPLTPAAPHDARRRYYRLTPQGRRAATAEAALLQRLVAAATGAGLLPTKEPP
jgi:DNA-binding MarR family transcriptional regulator